MNILKSWEYHIYEYNHFVFTAKVWESQSEDLLENRGPSGEHPFIRSVNHCLLSTYVMPRLSLLIDSFIFCPHRVYNLVKGREDQVSK